jgi:hypothetical protein
MRLDAKIVMKCLTSFPSLNETTPARETQAGFDGQRLPGTRSSFGLRVQQFANRGPN